MAHAGANGLGTPNLEKMAAFLKSFVCRSVYGEKVEPHFKRYKEIYTQASSTSGRHIRFCTQGFKACTIGENSA